MLALEQMHAADIRWYNALQLSRTVSAKTVLFADEKLISYSIIVDLCSFACVAAATPRGRVKVLLLGRSS